MVFFGCMKLSDYLATGILSRTELGERVGVSQAAISRYVNGERIPRPEIALKIEQATEGKVTIADHLAVYRGTRAAA
jgi:transcriptional regulator with XRE-family HTH domain